MAVKAMLKNLLNQFLCWLGCHDWREMNGRCLYCDVKDLD